MTTKTRFLTIFLIFFLITSCNLGTPNSKISETSEVDQILAMVTFKVSLPAPLPPGETLFLTELDEVTSLSFNQTRHTMEAEDSQNFKVLLALPLNSVLKYRYIRQGEYTQQEYAINGEPVRYRFFHAKEPTVVRDIIGQWIDTKNESPTGRLTGTVLDKDSGKPIPNIIVAIGGIQNWTSSEGIFNIQDLPIGIHNLVAYSPDGSYSVFQQEAFIAPDSATKAEIHLSKAKSLKVTFKVSVPPNTPPDSTIRIAGNLAQLGNTFAELSGGINHTAVRLPVLTPTSNGQFQITLDLPAGGDIRYKFTLGDGIWNPEHNSDGEFLTRQIILSDQDTEIKDRIIGWNDSYQEPVDFLVTVPDNTPSDEVVSIQFNPGYGWLEPIPMWPKGNNHWHYILYSPLKGLDKLQYRYCRDVQCGSADDSETTGSLSPGRLLDRTNLQTSIIDVIENWIWYTGKPDSAVVPNIDVSVRNESFIAGIEFQEGFHPSWFLRFPATVRDAISINSNWLIFQPGWTYTHNNPPFQEPIPGKDLYGSELIGQLNYTRSQSLKSAIFPRSAYPKQADVWWQESIRDFSWWVSWFDRYQEFINHYALVADQTGTEALILGDPTISPAFPNGKLSDNNPSNVPEDAASRWITLLENVRQRYKGQIWWVLDDEFDLQNPPVFHEYIDSFYIFYDESLTSDTNSGEEILVAEAGKYLDEKVLPLYQKYSKPIILAIEYPSSSGGMTGCLPGIETKCLDHDLLSRPNPDIPNISLDLQDQVKAYNAVFLAVNDRDWISGIVSRGYYPPLPLQDKSNSIHGKPASGVLWFWFGKFLNR